MKRYQLRRRVCHLFFQLGKNTPYIQRKLRLTKRIVEELLREGMWTPTELRRLRRAEAASRSKQP